MRGRMEAATPDTPRSLRKGSSGRMSLLVIPQFQQGNLSIQAGLIGSGPEFHVFVPRDTGSLNHGPDGFGIDASDPDQLHAE
jgi:hypothetical protein